MATYTKVTPVSAFALSYRTADVGSNLTLYAPSNIIDGDVSTRWCSVPRTHGGAPTTSQFAGVKFPTAVTIRKIVIRFSIYWSNDLIIGYSSAQPSGQSDITAIRTIDFKATPKDDLGVTIALNVDLTFFVPSYQASVTLSVYTKTSTAGGLGNANVTSDEYMGLTELTTYTEDVVVPPPSYVKESGTPTATSFVSGYDVNRIADSNTATLWMSDGGADAVTSEAVGYNLNTSKAVTKIEVNFYNWANTFRVLYLDASFPASAAGFTTARTINTLTTPNDDLGVPWSRDANVTNTILLDGSISAKSWALSPNAAVVAGLMAVNSGGRVGVNEMALFSKMPPAIAEIKGTSFCDKNVWSTTNTHTYINDGIASTSWYGSNYGDAVNSLKNFCGIKFASPKDVSYVIANIFVWGSTVKIGTWADGADPASASFTIANIIPISNFNVFTDKDLDGLAITARSVPYRFNATAKAIPGILLYCDDNRANILGNNGTSSPNNALCLRELQIFGPDGAVVQPPTFVDGLNPRPPTTIPVSPFTATPQNWVRTEYATAGDFDFVPDPTTSLLFIAIQGGGAGGAVTRDMNWNLIPVDSRVKGGETYVATTDGKVWSVGGGNGVSIGIQRSNPEVPIDWVRTPILPGANNGSGTDGTITAAPGGASALGIAGAAYQLAPVSNAGNAFIDFKLNNGAAYGLTVSAQSSFIWGNGTGWYSTNRGETSSTGYVQFNPITLIAGQVVRFTYGVSSESGYDKLTILVGGVTILTASGEASTFIDYSIPTSGSYVIRFQYTKDNSRAAGGDWCWVSMFSGNGSGYPPNQSGAAGRLLSGFVLPKPLRLRVGEGGVGIPSGQTPPTAAHGTRGSGGAGGGNGGTGVIVVYEYKSQLPFETPKFPDISFYNNATVELPGIYRTNYIGGGSNSKQNYVHKLRPRTKRVLVLMVGAGGGSCHWTDISRTVYNSGPAIVSTGTKTLTAESGGSSYKSDVNTYIGGSAGAFTSDVEMLYTKDGGQGAWFGANSPGRVTDFYGNYGNSSAGWPNTSSSSGPLITASGGSGALGFAVLTEAMLQSRELAIQVPGIGRGDYQAGTAGAVLIFETESVFDDVFASQVSELVLQRAAPYANTQVSQVNELVLQRDAIAPTSQVSQVVLMVLQRSPTVVGTSVTEQTIEIIGKAEPSNVRVSQSIQSVLVESEPPQQNVSQVAALVLIKENPTLLQMMDFGVMRFPMKNELYLSDICTVVGIGDGKSLRFQLEGDLPVGSTLIYNGVDIQSLTVMIKDGDTLQLHSGVTNWFVTTIYVFVYVSRADQIVREYAGFWSVLQATLSGRKRATIGTLSSKRTIILAKTGSAIGVKKAIAARSAKESKAQMAARRAIENVVKTSVTAKATNGNAVKAIVAPIHSKGNAAKTNVIPVDSKGNAVVATVVSKVAKDNAVLSVTQTIDRTVGEAILSDVHEFSYTNGNDIRSNVSVFKNAQKPKVSFFNMYKAAYASGLTVKSVVQKFIHTYGEAIKSQVQKFTARVGSPLLRFEMTPIPKHASQLGKTTTTAISGNNISIIQTGIFYEVVKQGSAKADQPFSKIDVGRSFVDSGYVVFDYSKSAKLKVVEFLFSSKQASSFFRPGYVYTPTFVATNSPTIEFTDQQNDKVAFIEQQYKNAENPKRVLRDIGYIWVPAPNRDNGATMHAVAAVSANRTYWAGLGWEGRHPPAYVGITRDYTVRENPRFTGKEVEYLRRETNRASGLTQEFAVRINNSNLIPVQYLVRKTNILLYGMRPILYQAGKNKVDKVKYYMGFTTQAEVNAFIVNFLKPTTKLKLDGYVYRVGVDETLVCEIRGPNMPLAWLLRGG